MIAGTAGGAIVSSILPEPYLIQKWQLSSSKKQDVFQRVRLELMIMSHTMIHDLFHTSGKAEKTIVYTSVCEA